MAVVSFMDRENDPGQRIERIAPADDAKASINVGLKLRALRLARGLTLQDGSALTGVSVSALSKIERNELSPTISTMQRIADGLHVELASLLTDLDPGPGSFGGRRSVNRAGTGSRHNTGTCNNVLLCPDLKNKRATPILTTVTARTPDDYPAWAKSQAEIFVLVLEGALVIHSRLYEPLELGPGDSVYYDATTEHTWTSAGPKDAVVLWVLVNI